MKLFLLIIFVFCLSLQINTIKLFAQAKNLKFKRIATDDGLSHGTVNCILQDKEGFMWFGTSDGLNKYDGYSFKTYEHNSSDTTSISNNQVRSICEDSFGNIWVGTSRGLNKFNKATGIFTLYQHDPKSTNSISDNDIQVVFHDRAGNLWVGTSKGLNKFDKNTQTFTLFEHNSSTNNRWADNTIHAIFEDHYGILWVGTSKGLSQFSRQNNTFIRFEHNTQATDTLNFNGSVKTIAEDKSGRLWIGTMGDGLKLFDKTTKTFKVYQNDIQDKNSLSNNFVFSILEDSFGNFWVGTKHGLNKFYLSSEKFISYHHDAINPATISGSTVLTIYEDHTKILWMGFFTGGISKYDLLRKKFSHIEYEAGVVDGIRSGFVYSLYEDHARNLWIGNSLGLERLDKKNGTFTHYSYHSILPKTHSKFSAHCMYEDRMGNLWLGLAGGGLIKFDKERKKFKSYLANPSSPNSLPHNYISVIYESKAGILWIGTRNGLVKFDPNTEKFITYKPAFSNHLNYHINHVVEDSLGRLWLATANDGLNSFDPINHIFSQYVFDIKKTLSPISNSINFIHLGSNGMLWLALGQGGLKAFNLKRLSFISIAQPAALIQVVINTILEDNNKVFWLSTRKHGVIRYDHKKKVMRTYGIIDGLQGNEFNKSFCKSITGEMYFGGNNGFNVFHPDSIQDNPYPPQVAITGFKVFDKSQHFSKQITLPYSDNFFSFDFIALSYAFPEKNRYAYQLENFNPEWIDAGNRRHVSYTNLDAGEYIFRVKAANHDGVWNQKSASIKIIITPPLWKTPLAYLVYMILFLSVLYFLRQYTVRKERLKSDLKLQRIESEKLMELDRLKTQFYTNISHEFRTPLTLIINPLEQMISEENSRKEYHLMHRNANQLLQLINQLLDLSKLESGEMKLELRQGDIVKFTKIHVNAFDSLAQSKGIKLRFNHEPDKIWTSFDEDKLKKIIYNLVSNAIKFTPEQGEIAISISLKPIIETYKSGKYIQIEITDNGIGIPSNKVNKIFDRFYQVDNSYTRAFEGTGIGLSLTKQLVELLGGTISVKSEENSGTSFKFFLPFIPQCNAFPPILEDTEDIHLNKTSNAFILSDDPFEEIRAMQQQIDKQLPLLLIVEDNADLRQYICDTFDTYRVIQAKNGEEALSIATVSIPDLVISDIMMPKMDGVELCCKLKTDQRTSHIPIILLTAKVLIQHRIEALNRGADDYISKPFHTEELRIRVKNLILQRKKLREHYSKEFPIRSSINSLNSIDDLFLQKAITIIEKNISDPQFTVEQFEQEIDMGHVQLYRKLKALTNQSPGEFIRDYRLKKAAALLGQHQHNVSQVAYDVGFNSVSYFTKCFRQLYGMTPSEFLVNRIN